MLNKPLSFLKQNQTSVFVALGLVFVAYYVMNYSNEKNRVVDNMESAPAQGVSNVMSSGPDGVADDDDMSLYAEVPQQATNPSDKMPNCVKESVIDASELLPKQSQWDENRPQNVDISVLDAGQTIGMMSQTLRNANLQIRSEPTNPQVEVGPWNQTTIAPDTSRRPLEIGCGSL